MNTKMTFCMDSDVKAKMDEICTQLGMTPATAFNIFAHAFVRENGMPFPVKIQSQASISREQMLEDAEQILDDFVVDYQRMSE